MCYWIQQIKIYAQTFATSLSSSPKGDTMREMRQGKNSFVEQINSIPQKIPNECQIVKGTSMRA